MKGDVIQDLTVAIELAVWVAQISPAIPLLFILASFSNLLRALS